MISDPEIAGRLATLDARDKLLRQQMTKQTELSQARAYKGTCQDMCPERERCLRIGSSLSIFERDEHNQPVESSMIKEYRRAGADQEEPLPHDLRTPEALERTMDYLCCNIMDDPRSRTQELTLHWYDFLWDRLRAIRKDITQQNICDKASAILVERCTRFHIHSCYAMSCVKDFDVDMNKRNLNDCLQMLRQMYTDLRNNGIICDGELEFQKYDILLHLEEDQLSSNVAMKTSEHRSSADMRYVTQLFYAYTNNYYYKFFKLMEQADYMTSCILSLYVNKVRLNAMKIIIASTPPKQPVMYPADSIIDSLGFDDLNDLAIFASSLSIGMQERGGKYFLILSKDLLNIVRQAGSNVHPLKSIRLVESKKMNLSVGQLVYREAGIQPRLVLDSVTSLQMLGQESSSLSTASGHHQPTQSISPPIIAPNVFNLHREPQEWINHIEQQQPGMRVSTHHVSYQPELNTIEASHNETVSNTTDQTTSSSSYTSQQDIPDDVESVGTPDFKPSPHQLDLQVNHDQLQMELHQNEQLQLEIATLPETPSPESTPKPSRSPLLALAAEAPVCRLRFRQPPRFHPFEPTPERKEKPKKKRTSFNDSIQSIKDEISDEMKANENLMKIVRMLS